jgi:hypothetical protein
VPVFPIAAAGFGFPALPAIGQFDRAQLRNLWRPPLLSSLAVLRV